MRIRTLTASDASQYRELMLEAYTLAADAFTSTPEERALEPQSWWINRVANPEGLTVSFGAEVEHSLIGTVALEYSSKTKTKHSALLIGIYVRAHARGQGVGRSLLQAALHHASQRPHTQTVTLTVTDGNEPAIRMYREAGFQAWGVEPLAIATPLGLLGKVHMSCKLAGHVPSAA